ncbi:radical SAM protein [Candidatus Sumerlaeota bacterium]|nr:radical SAM protein [Candidatus Sumerlaeota bacterium]
MNALRLLRKGSSFASRHIRQRLDYYAERGWSRPDKVGILRTPRCNARCLMCDFWKIPPDPAREEISSERWIDVIEELREWIGPFFLTLSGGEIFLKEGIYNIVRRAVELDISVSVLTNGLVFGSEKNVQRLIDTGLKAIVFSIDGPDPAVHDQFRAVPGLHAIATRGIDLIKSRKPDMTVSAMCIVMRDTVDRLPEFVEWARAVGVDRVLFQPLGPNPRAEGDPRWFEKNEWFVRDTARVDRAIDALLALKEKGAPIENSADNLEKIKTFFRNPSMTQITRSRCLLGQTNLNIDEYGDMNFCYKIPGSIGNVNDGPIRAAWKSDAARRSRREIKRCRRPCMAVCYRTYTLTEKVALFIKYAKAGKI